MQDFCPIVSIGLFLYAATLTWMFARRMFVHRKIMKNAETLKEWMKVHNSIQKNTGTLIEIRKLDQDKLLYWDHNE